MKFATRMGNIRTSPSAVMTEKSRSMRAKGLEVIALSSGEPDFPTPDHVLEAAHAAMLRGETKYTPIGGSVEMKQAAIDKFKRENGITYAMNEVIIGNGAKQVIFNALMAGTEPGDEIIMPAPYYVAYVDMIKFAGGVLVTVPCGEENDFKLTGAQLEASITPKTRWLMLNS
ncbi:MAG: aminotransferase class I/II-fold pyridoxal phosphate-dependent enzyme, partial [Rhodospirillales bacterium]